MKKIHYWFFYARKRSKWLQQHLSCKIFLFCYAMYVNYLPETGTPALQSESTVLGLGTCYLQRAFGHPSTDQNNEVTLEPIKCTAHSCSICCLEVHDKGIHFSEIHNIQIYIDQNIGDKGGFLSLKL